MSHTVSIILANPKNVKSQLVGTLQNPKNVKSRQSKYYEIRKNKVPTSPNITKFKKVDSRLGMWNITKYKKVKSGLVRTLPN